MPSTEAHLAQADHNKQFLAEFPSADKYRDWFVTVCFYTALHFVDAALANIGEDPQNHEHRHAILNRFRGQPHYARLRPHYRRIEDISRQARYQCAHITEQQVRCVAETDLAAVEKWVRWQLGEGELYDRRDRF